MQGYAMVHYIQFTSIQYAGYAKSTQKIVEYFFILQVRQWYTANCDETVCVVHMVRAYLFSSTSLQNSML